MEELHKLPPQPREDLILALVAFLRFQQKTRLHEVIEDIHLQRLFNPSPLIVLCLSLLFLASCRSSQNIQTVPVETIRTETEVDTIYLSTIQYDSIYINKVSYTDRTRDTLLIRETNTEFRYKLLRDTVERVKIEVVRDSIPYEVRIETVKEVEHEPTWFDHLTRTTFWLVIGALLTFLGFKLRKLFNPFNPLNF